jgi:hypothetical protein
MINVQLYVRKSNYSSRIKTFLGIIDKCLEEKDIESAIKLAEKENQSELWICLIDKAQEHSLLTKDSLLKIVKISNNDEVLVKALETEIISRDELINLKIEKL